MSLTPGQCIFISAGEFSGDLLAADLAHALKRDFPRDSLFGVAGPTMIRAGVTAIATTEELSVMGIVEVARQICELSRIERRVLAWIDRMQPKFAVLVDFPGFHFRIAEQLKLRGIPVFQYVAPKVWAWGRGRLPALRRDFTKVLGVLPFEEEFFRGENVPYEYVGSPHWDRMSKLELSARDLGFPADRPIVAFLPGSRMSELSRILPEMMKIRRELLRKCPNALCVIPLAPSLDWKDVAAVVGHTEPVVSKTSLGFEAAGFWWLKGWSLELMKIAQVAVVASGTATLECALAGTPMVVVYVMNDMSYAIARRAVSIKWASLVNLLMNEEVVPEHLQIIDAGLVATQLEALMEDSFTRRKMMTKFDELASKLRPGAAARASRLIHETLATVRREGA